MPPESPTTDKGAPSASQFLAVLNSQAGAAYRFGAKAKPSDTNPAAFDCSELVKWACDRLNVRPRMPDTASAQFRHCNDNYETGGRIFKDPTAALSIPGALLGRFPASKDPLKGPTGTGHIAVSQGNGMTIEARSSRYGVGSFSADNRGWTIAALIPGINYGEISTGNWLDNLNPLGGIVEGIEGAITKVLMVGIGVLLVGIGGAIMLSDTKVGQMIKGAATKAVTKGAV